MGEKSKQIGRLALREEGEWWNTYYAMPDTMEGAGAILSALDKAGYVVAPKTDVLPRRR